MRYDAPSTSWVFIARHDATRGAKVGGCCLRHYPTPADGLQDALRLAEAMTSKCAALALDYGGGKTVIVTKADPVRLAALKLMNSPPYQHPYYWAGFVVVGKDR